MGKASDCAPTLCLSYGYWSAPFRGIPPCGDAAAMHQNGSSHWLVVIDAIGHGPVAARISQKVIAVFDDVLNTDVDAVISPAQLIRRIHSALSVRHRDEQAAAGVFHFNLAAARMDLALVGNLDAVLLSPSESVRLHSQNGMVGGRLPTHIKEDSHSLGINSVLGVFSDGMRFNELADILPSYVYPGVRNQTLVSGAKSLVEGFRRTHDDSSCALVRIEPLNNG